MKKCYFVVLLAAILLLCSCKIEFESSKEKNTTPTPVQTIETKVSDYFPISRDIHMRYSGFGNEFAQFDSYVEYTQNNIIQLMKDNGGTSVVEVYKLEDNAVRKVYRRGETYFWYNFTNSVNMDEIMIMAPITVGTTWKLKDGSVRSITAVDMDVNTPSGNYKALEVTTQGNNYTSKDYYAKGTGLVKTASIPENQGDMVSSELEKIEKGVPFKRNIRFYFPDVQNDRIVYMDRSVEILTDQDMKYKFQKEMKTLPEGSGLMKLLSANTVINSIGLDDEHGIVTVDFSPQFVSEMNAGSGPEGMLLNSVANTIGGYYQVQKVIIALDGKPYSSGHIIMKPGEYFKVNISNTVEYKK